MFVDARCSNGGVLHGTPLLATSIQYCESTDSRLLEAIFLVMCHARSDALLCSYAVHKC